MTEVAMTVLIFSVYLAILLVVGALSARYTSRTPADYFLAGRGLGFAVLTMTMFATALSAWAFFGLPAEGYAHGFGAFTSIAIGDALFAVFIFFVGHRIWKAGRKFKFITPSEFFMDRCQSPLVALIYVAMILIFLVPFISLQIIGGGYALEAVSKGAIPYLWGAVAMAVVIGVYVFLGGMRAVAWTDTIQGGLMLFGMLIALFGIASAAGGFSAITLKVVEEFPSVLTKPGPAGKWTPLFSWTYAILLPCSLCMWPQLFQRFYAARDARVLKRIAIVWPVMIGMLFFPAILLGVWGRAYFESVGNIDQILPLMLDRFLPSWFATLVIVAALAAMMSTADSQLLAASSLLARDVYKRYINPLASPELEQAVGRWLVLGITFASFLVALRPPDVLINIGTWSFQGSTILFPVLIAGLYYKRATKAAFEAGAIVSTVVMLGFLSNIIPGKYTFGLMPWVPALLVASIVIGVVSQFTPQLPEDIIKRYYDDLWEPAGRMSGQQARVPVSNPPS